MAGGQVAAKNTRGGFICRSLASGENNEESCGRHSLVHCSPAATHDGDNVGSDDDDDACGGGGEDGGGGGEDHLCSFVLKTTVGSPSDRRPPTATGA